MVISEYSNIYINYHKIHMEVRTILKLINDNVHAPKNMVKANTIYQVVLKKQISKHEKKFT